MKRNLMTRAGLSVLLALTLSSVAHSAPIVGAVDEFTGANNGWVNAFGNVSGLGESGNVLTWNATFPGINVSEITSDTTSSLVAGGNANWVTLGALSISFDFTTTQSFAGSNLEIMFSDSSQGGFWRYDFGNITSGHYQIDLTFGAGWYFDFGPTIPANFDSALTSVDFVGLSLGGLTSDATFTLDNVTLDDALTNPVVPGAGGPVPEPATYAAIMTAFISMATGFRSKLREQAAKLGFC